VEKIVPDGRYHDDEIDLYDLWLVLKKRKLMILLIVLVTLGLAIAYATLAQKVYRVSNNLILNQMVGSIKQSELTAAIDELNELKNLRKEKTAQLLSMHVDDLDKIINIKASVSKGSGVVRVDIETLDNSAGIALMEALPGYIQSVPSIAINLEMEKALTEKNMEDLKAIIDNPVKDLNLPSIDLYTLREKYNQLVITMENIEEKQLVSFAWKTEPPLKPFKPNTMLIVSLGLVMGCLLGIFIAFFLDWTINARRVRGLE
jgi:LPS O-antigen subunit length determinant protein (WzzB/FepE family)